MRESEEFDERRVASKRVAEVLDVGLQQLQRGRPAGLALDGSEVEQAEESDLEDSLVPDAGGHREIALPQPVKIRDVAGVEGAHELLDGVAVLKRVTAAHGG